MTKNLFIILCLLLSTQLSSANKVDELKTDSDVAKFIRTVDTNFIKPKYASEIKIFSTEQILFDKNCDPNSKNWGIKNWVKADFNNDGRTDLLVIAVWDNYTNFIAIDKGDDTFQLITINYSSFENCELINTIKKDNLQLVLFHTKKFISEKPTSFIGKSIPETDTLIYKYDGFVELNRNPAHYKIDSITYFTGPCYGSCPTATICIDNLGNATYVAGYFSKKPGTFKSVIHKNDLNQIYDLINYLSIKKLKNKYSVNWTDSPGCSVKIKFSDGSTKYISDYGEEGTFGLERLYSLIYNLSGTQNWVSVK